MAWLFVPGLVDWSSDCSLSCPSTAPSVTSRGKPMPPRLWSRAWQRVPWMRRLSGTTCTPSMADAGVAMFRSSLPASPVSRGVPPAAALDSTMSAGSGLSLASSASFAKWSPSSSGWKTSLPLFPEADWPPCSAIWPTSGSMRNGIVCAQPTSAPRTDGNASLFWPTAVVQDAGSAARHTTTTGVMHGGTYLTDAIRQWPTPIARDWKDGIANTDRFGKTGGGGGEFAKQAMAWPTPTAEPYGSSQNGINGIGGANERPSANTPSLERMSRSFLPHLATSTPGNDCSPSDSTSRRPSTAKLNPLFVEWLMGLPVAWTDSAPAATPWSHYRQRMRSALWRLVRASGDED